MSDTNTPPMVGIPAALDSDAEDVVWALQTAEALWKRNERVDAIVWLRRAAQAAGEAEDDDRALTLARGAAELAEFLAQAAPSPTTASAPPSHHSDSDPVEDLLRRSQVDIEVAMPASGEPMSIDLNAVEDTISPEHGVAPPPADAPPADAPPVEPPPPPREVAIPPMPLELSASPPPVREIPPPDEAEMSTSEDTLVPRESAVPPPPAIEVHTRPRSIADDEQPRTAAEAHAGMLDPWAESENPTARGDGEIAEPPPPPARSAPIDTDDVVTSAPSPAMRSGAPPPPPVQTPPPPPIPRRPPPPLPPRAKSTTVSPAPPPVASGALDLTTVEAFADLPDDAREAFARAAKVEPLAKDEEVASFALVLVLEGSVAVAATIVEAPAQRLEAGAVLRSRGTLEHRVPMRLLCASDHARVATWDDDAVAEAFRSCSWVEDDLRAAGDRAQALVGLTMGPLGERLDASLRNEVTGRLTLRALQEGEIFAEQGSAIQGLVVVGVGELDLLRDDAVHGSVQAGEFLFVTEVLGGGRVPSTVRAGKGGALVMTADRHAAQELLVTCPPLLEIFAGM